MIVSVVSCLCMSTLVGADLSAKKYIANLDMKDVVGIKGHSLALELPGEVHENYPDLGYDFKNSISSAGLVEILKHSNADRKRQFSMQVVRVKIYLKDGSNIYVDTAGRWLLKRRSKGRDVQSAYFELERQQYMHFALDIYDAIEEINKQRGKKAG